MTIQTTIHLLEPVLNALHLEHLTGLQIFSADSLNGLHHPPFNPDFPALILPLDGAPAYLKTILLSQYPETHEVSVVRLAEQGDPVKRLPLEQLEPTANNSTTALYIPALPRPSSFERFQETIAHLRAPEGCPWDRKQTHASLRPYLLEETYEALDALDRGDMHDLREELGDLLLQIVLHSQIAVEAGEFRLSDVLANVIAKIIRRHPHVWGNVSVNDDQDVKVNWDKLKQVEKKERESRLDGVPKALPALSLALSYQDRAARVKFDWPTIEPVFAKVLEEIEEVKTAPDPEAREGEIGDLLFAVVNWARWLEVDPEAALRGTNERFYQRFHYIEQQAAAQGRDVDTMSLDEMDALWNEAKTKGL